MTRPRRALIALGSNIDPRANLPAAVRLLAGHARITVVLASGVYESPPLGRPGDPCFQNAAVAVDTTLGPAELRAVLRRVESALGRVRRADRYAPRTIDLDLAAYEGFEGEAAGTKVPDPEIAQRAFLAIPLAEVAPDWVLPGVGRRLDEIAAGFDREAHGLRRLRGRGLGLPRLGDSGAGLAGRATRRSPSPR